MTIIKTKVKKAVFPVAGLGTRFLPVTKAIPKEMLPIIDKPLIQYAVEEAIAAGITEMIFVTSNTKRAIEDHFDSNFELEYKLAESGKKELLETVKNILPKGVFCAYVRQPKALGLGHAVLCAKELIGNEPFAVLLADDLIDSDDTICLKQMVDNYDKVRSSIVLTQHIIGKAIEKYGVVEVNDAKIEDLVKINGIVEKPHFEEAPSEYGVIGRYILTPRIFHFLEHQATGSGNEIQLTDGIAALLKEEAVYMQPLQGKRYDCGSKIGYLEATIKYAVKNPYIADDFLNLLKSVDI